MAYKSSELGHHRFRTRATISKILLGACEIATPSDGFGPMLFGIFQRYLKLGSVHALQRDLEERGMRSKRWINKAGDEVGGNVLQRFALYHLPRNRHYLGEIPHKGRVYPGQHTPILDRELFEAVQQELADNAVKRTEEPLRPGGSPLSGLFLMTKATA